MTLRKMALALMLAVGAVSLSTPLPALSAVNLDIDIAPPAPRVEVVPPPRVGWVWAPGFWAWRGHRHFWVAGRWMRERPGFHWVPAHWQPRGPHWHFVPGHWAR